MPRRRYARFVVLPALLIAAGTTVLVVEALGMHINYLATVLGGLLVTSGISLGNLSLIWATREPADAMWRDGYDCGYRAGLEAGEERTRPTVVPIRRRPTG
jgi:hypothetical protein